MDNNLRHFSASSWSSEKKLFKRPIPEYSIPATTAPSIKKQLYQHEPAQETSKNASKQQINRQHWHNFRQHQQHRTKNRRVVNGFKLLSAQLRMYGSANRATIFSKIRIWIFHRNHSNNKELAQPTTCLQTVLWQAIQQSPTHCQIHCGKQNHGETWNFDRYVKKCV